MDNDPFVPISYSVRHMSILPLGNTYRSTSARPSVIKQDVIINTSLTTFGRPESQLVKWPVSLTRRRYRHGGMRWQEQLAPS